jgi:hypothetical protein
VPVRQSVRPDYVVCLECGFRSRTLRRHLRVSHGLERAAYYARWRLPPDHPITAPGYSARRSALAKALGLGRRRQMAKAAPEIRAGRQTASPEACGCSGSGADEITGSVSFRAGVLLLNAKSRVWRFRNGSQSYTQLM